MECADEDVTLEEVLLHAFRQQQMDVHTCFPARVESYDAPSQTCEVTPQISRHLEDGQGGVVPEALPKLADVPVLFPRCGSFFMSFPLQAGDYVLVVCSQKNIGLWRQSGSSGDPGDTGMHTLDGAVAIPGIYPDSKSLQNADATNMVLGSDTDPAGRIALLPSQVQLGGGAQFVALANKVKANFDTLYNLLDGVFGAASTVIANGGPAPADLVYAALKAAIVAATAAGSWPLGGVAAQNVKAT